MEYILKYENNEKFTERDFWPYMYPSRSLKKLLPVYLGTFIRWDTKKQVEIIKRARLERRRSRGYAPDKYNYEKIECYMQGMRDYLKFFKRGYSRVTQMTSKDVRENRMSVEEAKKLVDEYEGKIPHSLSIF